MSKKAAVKEESAHSEFGPSAADRYVNCAGSVELSRRMPKSPDTDASKEGTLAHECLESFLKNGPQKWGKTRGFLVASYPDEMVDHGLEAARAIWKIFDSMPGAELFPEEKVDISHFTKPGEKGTLDCAIVQEFDKLVIIDYKYGAGVFVDVEENLQLIAYALAVAKKYEYNFATVELYIIQPRKPDAEGRTVRGWACTIEKLVSYEQVFRDAIARAEDPLAEFRAGDWCQFCPGKAICAEVSTLALAQAQIDFAPEEGVTSMPVPTSIAIPNLATILPALDKIEIWIDAVREHALHVMKAGHKIPGRKLVGKRSTRKYLDAKKAEKDALKRFGKIVLSEPELLSPAQLEKVLKEDYDNAVVKKWFQQNVSNVSSGVTIAPESDPRPAVDPIAESFPDDLEEQKPVSKKKKGSKKK